MYILQEMKWVLNLIWHGLWKKEKMPLFSANKIFYKPQPSEEGVKITQIGHFTNGKLKGFDFSWKNPIQNALGDNPAK